MDVTQLPFNQLIGLETTDPAAGTLVRLPEGQQYTNHLGSVHAAALLAVAEAGSGTFLLQAMGDATGFVPVVRKLEAKFRKPASGAISARCTVAADEIAHWSAELATRGRLSVSIPVEVVDAAGTLAMTANVEWFIARAI